MCRVPAVHSTQQQPLGLLAHPHLQCWLILPEDFFSCLIYPCPNEIIFKKKIISLLMLHIQSYISPVGPRKVVEGGIYFGFAQLTCEGVQSLLQSVQG